VAAEQQGSSALSGTIMQAFATPIARITYPHALAFNEELAAVVLARLYQVDNQFTYKVETSPDLTQWGEPTVDSLTAWVLKGARRFVETVTGRGLEEAYVAGVARDRRTFNAVGDTEELGDVSIVATRSWASVYAKGSRHPGHFHPNTAIAAIYYVQASETCDIDLLDPRVNLDYFDPGIQFADEGGTLRLRCKPGELLLFPGWLKHSVPESGGDSLRISISWNLVYQVGS
jgi:hypothetical protein